MYRVNTVFTGIQGTPWLSTFWFNDTAGTAQQAVTAAGAFWTSCTGSNAVNGLSWSCGGDVATVDEATGETTAMTSTTAVTGSGTAGSDPLPAASQILLRWRTGIFVGGREIRGRTFIPGIVEANSNGRVSSALQTFYQTTGNTLIGDANSVLVCYSRKNAQFRAVTACSTWSEFAVRRSRRD